ncbi:hypothetical protein KAE78_13395 [Microbacterium sp. NIBRBAC000506063]|nr:sugar-transfer associated ATP-grasp domain-containing protein [Microbacterium sp. NIBRBAC000506063]QTV79728.1 hypothetical protein KAE78_13395 [Microbacterium sp. NIBRBAC000506063]
MWAFATQIAEEQGKWAPKVFVDMLIWSAFHDTAYIDYYEADFALLTKSERRTFMTSLVQHHLANALNDPHDVMQFQNKIAFNRRFAEYLGRDWLDLEETDVEAFRAFTEANPVIIAKTPVGREGKGVFRYDTAEVTDLAAFRAELLEKGQRLIEQPIVQHPYLAEYCAGTVNTTRVVSFFDGETVHILMAAQKFGRGAVSDQFTWGGFFTMIDENGRSFGPGTPASTRAATRRIPTPASRSSTSRCRCGIRSSTSSRAPLRRCPRFPTSAGTSWRVRRSRSSSRATGLPDSTRRG